MLHPIQHINPVSTLIKQHLLLDMDMLAQTVSRLTSTVMVAIPNVNKTQESLLTIIQYIVY